LPTTAVFTRLATACVAPLIARHRSAALAKDRLGELACGFEWNQLESFPTCRIDIVSAGRGQDGQTRGVACQHGKAQRSFFSVGGVWLQTSHCEAVLGNGAGFIAAQHLIQLKSAAWLNHLRQWISKGGSSNLGAPGCYKKNASRMSYLPFEDC